MSADALKWAVEQAPPMPAQLVATLTALAYHADRYGQGAFPSLPRLAAMACKAERSVRRDLRELEDLKLIRRGDQNRTLRLPADRRPVVYDLAIEIKVPGGRAGDDEGTSTSARTLASSRARGLETRRANQGSSDPAKPAKRGDAHVRGDVDVRADAHVTTGGRGRHNGGTPTSAKTKDEPKTEQLPKDSLFPPATQPSLLGEPEDAPAAVATVGVDAPAKTYDLKKFGAFWLAYPKRKQRPEATEAWKAAIDAGVDPDHMIAAATAYSRERVGEDPKYTLLPANWLIKGCYDDEPDEPVQPPSGGNLPAVVGGNVLPFQSGQHRPSTTDQRAAAGPEVGRRLQALADARRAQQENS